jgi:hypothetical protein
MNAHELATRVQAKRIGKEYRVACPAHPDTHPSLEFRDGDDGIVLTCRSRGCSWSDIVTAWNLTPADLFTEPASTTTSIVAEHRYCDERGVHLFDVVRFEPKDFRQRRADGVWKMTGVRRVVYHLDTLHGQSVVYLVKGEKDADRLQALGLPATTNPGGAGTWRPDYTQQLTTAGVEKVVVIPDSDDAGRAHAETVARSCHAAGITVKVVTLPDVPSKGDVSDYLAQHSKDDLIALVKQTAVFVPQPEPASPAPASTMVLTSIGDLLNEPEETVDWLVEDRIPAGGTAIGAAKPKIGKSTAARALCLAVARGDSWLGFSCAQGVAWYLALEGRRRDIRAHFRQMGARSDDALRVFVGQAPKDVVAQVRQLAERERPALIVVDTMQRFLKAQSTDDYAEMTTLLDHVIGIAQTSGATLLLLHHSGKANRDSLDAVLGSTAITGSADTILLLTRTDRYRTISTVQRVGDYLPETVIALDETGCVQLGPSRHEADERLVAEAVLAPLQQAATPLTEAELEPLVDARTALKRKALRDLVAREQVSRTGRGGKSDPYRYAVSCSCSLVPSKEWEQENNNSLCQDSFTKTHSDSCSHVSTQGSGSRCSTEPPFGPRGPRPNTRFWRNRERESL